MKCLNFIFLLFVFNANLCNQIESEKNYISSNDLNFKDSIILSTQLIESGVNDNVFLEILITNRSQASILILPEPFLVNNNFLNDHVLWVGGNRYTSPNIVYFNVLDEPLIFQGDGEYLYEYNKFPKTILLNPLDSTTLIVEVKNEFIDNSSFSEIEYSGWLIYADYPFSDSIIKYFKEDTQIDFHANISKPFNHSIELKKIDEDESKFSNINVNEVTKFIRSSFVKKIGFRNEQYRSWK